MSQWLFLPLILFLREESRGSSELELWDSLVRKRSGFYNYRRVGHCFTRTAEWMQIEQGFSQSQSASTAELA